MDPQEGLDARFAPTPPEVVVFDVGNVLLRWTPENAVAVRLGHDAADAFVHHREFDFGAWNLANDGGRSLADAIDVLRAAHPELVPAAEAYVEEFLATLEPIEESIALLRELHALGVHLVALTNFSAELFDRTVRAFDFFDAFEDIVVSGEEGVLKPDPEIWEVLAERTDHLGSLEDFLFVDDSITNVASALDAGLDAVQFTTAQDLRQVLIVRGFSLTQ